MPILPQNTLKGLVLAGGISQRMKQDKSLLHYYEKPHYQYVYEMLEAYCEQVFLSCKSDKHYPLPCILDRTEWIDIGPIAGLFSAFSTCSCAWLVVAVDYPLFLKEDVAKLLAERDKNCVATVYYHAHNDFFEPFLGIYESTFGEVLKEEIAKGNYSLQKILQNNVVKKVLPLKEENIISVDTIAAYQATLSHIQKNRPLKGMDDSVYE